MAAAIALRSFIIFFYDCRELSYDSIIRISKPKIQSNEKQTTCFDGIMWSHVFHHAFVGRLGES